MKKIALEEHFTTRAFLEHLRGRKDFPRLAAGPNDTEVLYRTPTSTQPLSRVQVNRLLDMDAARLAEMDRAGIDMQGRSMTGPGVQQLHAAAALAKQSNDELAQAIGRHPDRLSGLATLAYGDVRGSCDELQRAVKKLGLKGVKLNSHLGGQYLDDRNFWPLFETAQALDVPVYLHPKEAPEPIYQAMAMYPEMTRAMWGYS